MPRTNTATTEPATEPSIAELEAQVAEGEQELAVLKSKQVAFPAMYEGLLRAGNFAGAVKAKREYGDIPDQVFATEVGLLEKQAELCDLQANAARAEISEPEFVDDIDRAQQALRAAQDLLAVLLTRQRNLKLQARDHQMDGSQHRLERDRLLRERARHAAAPVVTSLPHAPTPSR